AGAFRPAQRSNQQDPPVFGHAGPSHPVNVLTSNLLASLKWVEHGFGTRDAQIDQAAMASLKQVHSDVSLVARGPGCIGEGDALITGESGIAVSIRTADGFPIRLAAPRTNSVAGIHAGWRGTAAGIVAAALA